MKRFFKYTIPSIFSMWIFALYTMIDGYFVANYIGNNEFSAINISMPVVTTFFALAMLFSIGTQAKVGHNLGSNNIKKANEIFSSAFVILICVGLSYTFLLSIIFPKLISFLGASIYTERAVKEYLGIIIPFAVFFMTTYQLEVLVKLDGYPHFSAISVFTAAMTNLILDYIFIVPLKMGVFGAGLATGIAQVVSTVLLVSHFLRKKGKLQFVRERNYKDIKNIILLGMGDAISEISIGYTVFLFNTVISKTLGQAALVIYTVISYISVFVQVTMTGIAQGLAPLFAFDYGKKNFLSIKKSIILGLSFIFTVSIIFLFFCTLNPDYIIKIFLKDDLNLFLETKKALFLYASSYIFIGFNILIVTLFASLGEGKYSLMISLLRTPIFISLVMLIYIHLKAGQFIWLVLTCSEALTATFSAYFMYKKIIKSKFI